MPRFASDISTRACTSSGSNPSRVRANSMASGTGGADLPPSNVRETSTTLYTHENTKNSHLSEPISPPKSTHISHLKIFPANVKFGLG
jgi:hypothetical protein